ncbi:MAG: magnesium transporter [Clostridiales bacterium]|nr:magnesium transporter [Clostridiales bacterium]
MEEIKFQELFDLLENNHFAKMKAILSEMNEVDVAEFLQELETEKLLLIYRILPKDLAADVFPYLETENQQAIVEGYTDKELRVLIDDLFLDDTVDFLEEVPANVVRRVLANTDAETRSTINRFLQYPDNSAGSIMTNEMVELHDNLTVNQAIENIRKTGVDKETIYTCYCIDPSRHLIGILPLKSLILADGNTCVRDIMDDVDQVISVKTHTDQEEVAALAKKYDLLTIPVVDNENRLVGIITIDDIVDIIEEENTEDFEKMALVHPSESEYLKTGVFKLAKNRILWLLILMISGTFTGQLIDKFQGMLSLVVGLTASIPMLMDTGGNSGGQTATLIIRGLALGDITVKDYFKVLWKEIRVAAICGSILAVVNLGRLFIFGHADAKVYLVTCGAMFCAVVFAKTIGCTLPILAKLCKLDPALMAGPMITTIVDAVTLMIYFGLASVFLLHN